MTDAPCLCDPENRECKPTTRLNVLLPDVPGIGCWRLDSTGYYAAVELAGVVDLLEIATSRGVLLPARLRIDQRTALRGGQTFKFGVPTLDIDVRPLEMHAITQAAGEGEVAAAPTTEPLGYQPVAALPRTGVGLKEGLAAANGQTERREHARSSAPIGDVAEFEFTEPVPVPDTDLPQSAPTVEPQAGARMGTEHATEGDGSAASADGTDEAPVASTEQQRLLMATAREAGISDAKRYDLTERVCGEGIRSVKRVPADKVDALLGEFQTFAQSAAEPSLQDQLLGYADVLGMTQQVEAALSQHPDDEEWLTRQIARLKERYEGGAA